MFLVAGKWMVFFEMVVFRKKQFEFETEKKRRKNKKRGLFIICLLYTSDAADEMD